MLLVAVMSRLWPAKKDDDFVIASLDFKSLCLSSVSQTLYTFYSSLYDEVYFIIQDVFTPC